MLDKDNEDDAADDDLSSNLFSLEWLYLPQ